MNESVYIILQTLRAFSFFFIITFQISIKFIYSAYNYNQSNTSMVRANIFLPLSIMQLICNFSIIFFNSVIITMRFVFHFQYQIHVNLEISLKIFESRTRSFNRGFKIFELVMSIFFIYLCHYIYENICFYV